MKSKTKMKTETEKEGTGSRAIRAGRPLATAVQRGRWGVGGGVWGRRETCTKVMAASKLAQPKGRGNKAVEMMHIELRSVQPSSVSSKRKMPLVSVLRPSNKVKFADGFLCFFSFFFCVYRSDLGPEGKMAIGENYDTERRHVSSRFRSLQE